MRPAERLREMRRELHQPQPPTTTTGTTYSSEMYQWVRHAISVIVEKLALPHHASSSDTPAPSVCPPPAGIRERRART
jgi:hypothetical protein